ncbi:MAG: uncharacterized protein JWO36_3525 [Myxococcales bacterium]|nr:uncharacterized protein [Myxococcales bacterium]
MASKKTEKTTKKAAPKAAKKAPAKKAAPKAAKDQAEAKPALPRHPNARLDAAFESKEKLAKTLAASIARDDEDTDVLTGRLAKASNMQLLRLQKVVATVKEKFGSRDKLIEAIGTAEKKSKDKDYLAKLNSFSLPQLLDLAVSGERRARA